MRDEDQGRAEGADEAENVGNRYLEGACKHDSEGEGEEGEIGGRRVGNLEEERVGEDGEQG